MQELARQFEFVQKIIEKFVMAYWKFIKHEQ